MAIAGFAFVDWTICSNGQIVEVALVQIHDVGHGKPLGHWAYAASTAFQISGTAWSLTRKR
jgi:hypothetical protein